MNENEMKRKMASNIQKKLYESGKSRKEVADAVGVGYTTFADWVNGRTMPRMDKLEKLAEFFGCKKSDLLVLEIDSDTETVSIDASQIAKLYQNADDQTKEMVRRILKG